MMRDNLYLSWNKLGFSNDRDDQISKSHIQ